MKERGIIFSGEMVRAILDGRKTQTRRVIKPQPDMMEDRRRYQSVLSDGKRKHGQLDDLLWVRETWTQMNEKLVGENKYIYKADCAGNLDIQWKPSIHMPKAAARIWLKIQEVRVERLQYIGPEDIEAEGAEIHPNTFIALWDSLNAKRGYSWESNPWVWVISFERMNERQALTCRWWKREAKE